MAKKNWAPRQYLCGIYTSPRTLNKDARVETVRVPHSVGTIRYVIQEPGGMRVAGVVWDADGLCREIRTRDLRRVK